MQYIINGYKYTYNAKVKENEPVRHSFMELSKKTFGLDFESWYHNGWWVNDYIPHVLLDGTRVAANVSVNIINTIWDDKPKRYIQLGTVMTAPEYRNRGLGRWLIEKVIKEWKEKCDAVYLFANDSVLDFYPKFGFVKAKEYQCRMPVYKKTGDVKKLDMALEQDKALLLCKYTLSNPFSALPMIANTGLLMFYCSQFMKDMVYYIEKQDAIVIADYEEEKLICYDVFCKKDVCLEDILCVMAAEETKTVVFGFSPKNTGKSQVMEYHNEDTTLFVLEGKENIFTVNQLMLPLLSHA